MGPSFRCLLLLDMSPSTTPGDRRLHVPSSFTADAGLRPLTTGSALPKIPQTRFPWGYHFGAVLRFTFAATCRFAGPPSGSDRAFAQPLRTFTSGLPANQSPESAAGYNYGGNWASSTGESFTRWIAASFAAQSSSRINFFDPALKSICGCRLRRTRDTCAPATAEGHERFFGDGRKLLHNSRAPLLRHCVVDSCLWI